MSFLIGAALALTIGRLSTWVGFDRDKSFYPTVLLVVASYYVLFGVMGGSFAALLTEFVMLVPFLLAAVLGFKKTPWLVVLGLAGHGILDAFHPHLVSDPGVPVWWPEFCASYDVAAAGYLATLLLAAQRRLAGPELRSQKAT